MAGDYRFTDVNYLLEGANKVAELGSRSISLFFEGTTKFQNHFRIQYPDNKANLWPPTDPASLKELAQTVPFRTVFQMPAFSTIVLTAYSPAFPWGAVLGQNRPVNYEKEEAEFYELTKYLLTAYRDCGKVFILTNWEGDNIISGSRGLPYNHQQDHADTDLQAMIDWLSARQRGVARARAEIGDVPGVKVLHAVTINRTLDVSRKNLKRVLNKVLPFVNADMVGCSCYDAMIDNPEVTSKARTKELMSEALEVIDQWVPDPLKLGKRRIFLTEYGLFENDWVAGRPPMTPAEAIWRTEAVLESVAEFGASYSFFWQLFDNECKPSPGGARPWPELVDVPPLGDFETALGFDNPRRPTNNSC